MISKGGARDSKGPACPVSCDVPVTNIDLGNFQL